MIHSPNGDLMFGQRLQHWPNVKKYSIVLDALILLGHTHFLENKTCSSFIAWECKLAPTYSAIDCIRTIVWSSIFVVQLSSGHIVTIQD